MADAMGIALNEGMHALPPTRHVAPVVHAPGEGDGQNWSLASAGIAVLAVATPQPRRRWTRTSPLNRKGK
jgi:hypothetical protein